MTCNSLHAVRTLMQNNFKQYILFYDVCLSLVNKLKYKSKTSSQMLQMLLQH